MSDHSWLNIREWLEEHWAQKETIKDLYKEIDSLKEEIRLIKNDLKNHSHSPPVRLQTFK